MKKIYKVIRAIIRYIKKDSLYLEHFAIGINSFVDQEKDKHIIMLDYDNVSFFELSKDIFELSKFFNLSDCDIFSTSQGYHVFYWFDIVPYTRLKMIINYSRCDPTYKYISRYYDHKTVRACGKYKELDTKFLQRFRGVRKSTNEEIEIGNLKRMEYLNLRKFHKILDKKSLKEVSDSGNKRSF